MTYFQLMRRPYTWFSPYTCIFVMKQIMYFFHDFHFSDQLYGFIDAEVSVEEIEQKCKFSTLNFVLNSPHKSEDVKFFLERGANVHFYKNVNDGDRSVLIRAVKSMFLEEEDVRILVEHGAYPHQTDSSGLTALQLICRKTKCNVTELKND